jgi:hypothetical protein
VSDIRIKITTEGYASVELSEAFLAMPLDKQIIQLQAKLLRKGLQWPAGVAIVPTAPLVKSMIIGSMLSALKDGVALGKVVWRVKGGIEGLSHEIVEDYWLRLDL